MMIRTIILTLLLLFSFNSLKSEINNPTKENKGYLYRDLGCYSHEFGDHTYIKVCTYIQKKLNTTGKFTEFTYEYQLVAISQSFNGYEITETWLFGNKIFYENDELTGAQFPNGVTTYINTTPTVIYSWFTNDDNIGMFYMKWSKSTFENR